MSFGLMKEETGDLVKNAYFLNPIDSLKHYLSGLETTNWLKQVFLSFQLSAVSFL